MTDARAEGVAAPGPVEPASPSTRELVAAFGAAMLAGDRDALAGLLADDVVALVPGRHPRAGLHRGASAVASALVAEPLAGVRVVGVDVTEVLVEGSRGFVVLCVQAALDVDDDALIAFEIAMHVQCRGAAIVGITEYAGDQYSIDELLGG